MKKCRGERYNTVEKYTDFPSNTTVLFIATQLHVSAHCRTFIRMANKNLSKEINTHAKYVNTRIFLKGKKKKKQTHYSPEQALRAPVG
jgi:beta-galactosidase beta subunit